MLNFIYYVNDIIKFQSILRTLESIIDDVEHSAGPFCEELHKQISEYFNFILNPEAPDFIDLYYVASYLAPVHKFVIGPSELAIVRKYLEGRKACLIYLLFHFVTF